MYHKGILAENSSSHPANYGTEGPWTIRMIAVASLMLHAKNFHKFSRPPTFQIEMPDEETTWL